MIHAILKSTRTRGRVGRPAAFGCVLVIALLLAPIARANPDQPPEVERARELFEAASQAREAGRFDECAARLREAIAIKETPGLHFHLAYCEEHLGHFVAALAEYDRAGAVIESGQEAPDVAQLLGPARARVEVKVSHLRVITLPDTLSVTLTIDGEAPPRRDSDLGMMLDPGVHQLHLQAPRYSSKDVRVVLEPGKNAEVSVTLEPEALEPASATNPRQETEDRPREPAYRLLLLTASAGVAVAGLGVGVAYTLKRPGATDRVRDADQGVVDAGGTGSDACAAPPPDTDLSSSCQNLAQAVDERDRVRRLQTIGFAVSAVGVAATAAIWTLWVPASSMRVAVRPGVAGGDGWGLRLGSSF